MSPELFRLLVTWVLPPALGAVIGYVTNDIAIRMLFRPLTEKRILGIRVPLTPGIIPKQRHALAESIGRMVSEHLITEDAVKEHLQAESFRSGLQNAISSLTQRALAASPSRLGRGAQGLWNGSLRSLTGGIIGRFLRSPGFLASVRSVVTRLVATLGDRLLSEIASAEGLKKIVRTRVVPLLAGAKAAGWARSAVRRWARRHVTENTPVAQLLPEAASSRRGGGGSCTRCSTGSTASSACSSPWPSTIAPCMTRCRRSSTTPCGTSSRSWRTRRPPIALPIR
jgi:hypothetical protein